MDFAYMKKPVVYFQFDTDTYRKGHLPTGYFDSSDDGFGPIAHSAAEVISDLEDVLRNNCQMDEVYLARANRFFTIYDRHNSERTYLAVKEMIEKP